VNAQGQTVPPQVAIAGISAPVLFSGLSSITGLYQVNVQVPPGVASGKQSLVLSIAGIASNTVSIQIAP
jgi:uncharacterized protein (TIGR03437 family)